MKIASLTLVLAGLVLPLKAQEEKAAAPVWLADFDQAVLAAKEAKKDLLVDFTGSDWCGWCIRLDKEVFEHQEFLVAATKSFVLVKLDFPQGEEAQAKVPNPERNEELKGKWGIQGFPSILLVTVDGNVFGRTGYREGGPAKYVDHLAEISLAGRKALEVISDLETKFGKAEGEARAPLIGQAVDLLLTASDETVGLATLQKIARHGLDVPALREKALRGLLKSGAVDDAIKQSALELDPKNEKGLHELVVFARMKAVDSKEGVEACLADVCTLVDMGPIKDATIAPMIFANAAFWSQRVLGDEEKAKTFATKLKALPNLEEHFQRLITDILGDK